MKNNKLKKILIASIILFVVTGLTKVILCSSMAVKSAQLAELSTKKQDLQKQVSKLLFEESRLSNLKFVENKAYEMGFTDMEGNLINLDTDAPVAVASVSLQ